MVEVRVSGAVLNLGRYQLTAPATISDALEAAGGLARRPRMWPAGPLTVRRRGDGKVDAWHFSLDDPQAYKTFELQSGDLIVVQWHIADV